MTRKYHTIRERLIANSQPLHDNAQACWIWTGKKRCRFGYGRFNLWVPGLRAHVQLTAHIASWVLLEIGSDASADDLFLAYYEFRCSGLEIDHLCVNPRCINDDHLESVTKKVNCERRSARRHRDEYVSYAH